MIREAIYHYKHLCTKFFIFIFWLLWFLMIFHVFRTVFGGFPWIWVQINTDFRDFPKSDQLREAVTSWLLIRFGCSDMQKISTDPNWFISEVYREPAQYRRICTTACFSTTGSGCCTTACFSTTVPCLTSALRLASLPDRRYRSVIFQTIKITRIHRVKVSMVKWNKNHSLKIFNPCHTCWENPGGKSLLNRLSLI